MTQIDSIWTGEAQQQIYRQLLSAMSYPGRIMDLSAWLHGSHSLLAVLATLCDNTTSLADETGLLDEADFSMLRTNRALHTEADFILASASEAPSSCPAYKVGTLYYPEQSATLILKIDALTGGQSPLRLTGPGVNGEINIAPHQLAGSWLNHRDELNQEFPMGIDIILCSPEQIIALPRTTIIQSASLVTE